MENEHVILNPDAINRINEILSDVDTLRHSHNLMLYCLENEVYVDSEVEIISFGLLINSYISMLKSKFTEFLQEQKILY